MRGLMASLGIEKGKPFKPDARMKEILSAGAEVGMKMCHALRFGEKLKNTKYWPNRQWNNVLNVPNVDFTRGTYTDVDAKVGMFIIGYSISPAMVLNMVGKGSKYPFAYRDADGDFLLGSRSYKLHIPANVPAANFWSITLYDASNASGLKNDQPFPSIGSLEQTAVQGRRLARTSTSDHSGRKACRNRTGVEPSPARVGLCCFGSTVRRSRSSTDLGGRGDFEKLK